MVVITSVYYFKFENCSLHIKEKITSNQNKPTYMIVLFAMNVRKHNNIALSDKKKILVNKNKLYEKYSYKARLEAPAVGLITKCHNST